ncbi:MAG TPA: hypothetical protein VKA37_05050 [Halobacteriales archaeon]|nr:hypothetical protein [Halobacteriales archaeon]
MDEAAAVSRVAADSVGTVDPEPLHETLVAALEACSAAPGVMVLTSARAIDGGVDVDAVADRVAGVQLVYAGLAVTRRLAGDPPWADGGAEAANLDVLAADILVARGAYLLAGTEASGAAVEVIRAFGRDQTEREGDPTPDHDLEADIFELAVVAGSTAVGPGTPPQLLEWATGFATSIDREGMPEPAAVLAADPPTGPLPVADDRRADDRVTSSGDR